MKERDGVKRNESMIRKKCTKNTELSVEHSLGNLIKDTRKKVVVFSLDLKTSEMIW